MTRSWNVDAVIVILATLVDPLAEEIADSIPALGPAPLERYLTWLAATELAGHAKNTYLVCLAGVFELLPATAGPPPFTRSLNPVEGPSGIRGRCTGRFRCRG